MINQGHEKLDLFLSWSSGKCTARIPFIIPQSFCYSRAIAWWFKSVMMPPLPTTYVARAVNAGPHTHSYQAVRATPAPHEVRHAHLINGRNKLAPKIHIPGTAESV